MKKEGELKKKKKNLRNEIPKGDHIDHKNKSNKKVIIKKKKVF